MDNQPIQLLFRATVVPDAGKATNQVRHMLGIDGNPQCVLRVLTGDDDIWGGDPSDHSTDFNVWRDDLDGSIRYWTGSIESLGHQLDHFCETGKIEISLIPDQGVFDDLPDSEDLKATLFGLIDFSWTAQVRDWGRGYYTDDEIAEVAHYLNRLAEIAGIDFVAEER